MTQAIETKAQDMAFDLSSMGTVNTMFAASFSKLGIPVKTKVSVTVLEDALKGTVKVKPLPVGTSVSGKVDKLCAHFYCLTINEQQAQAGIVVRVTSTTQSRFKLLYFEHDVNGGYGLASQEDSEMTDKITSAGMYFLHFQVFRMDSIESLMDDKITSVLGMSKEDLDFLDFAFFKRLEGLQPCEVSELKPGTHLFAVYGDNFFKTATYTIEAVCAKTFEDTTKKLKKIETQMLRKRNEMRQFEEAYRKVDELLKQRDIIHSTFTVMSNYGASGSESCNTKVPCEESKANSPGDYGNLDGKDKSSKKKCKLGILIETNISATVRKDALNRTVKVRPLPIGTSVSGKVDTQCAHFFCVTINEQQAQAGIVVRVTSAAQSRFKLLFFGLGVKGGYVLVSQKGSKMTGKITSAGMYSLHFRVYRNSSTVDALAMAKDPKAVFFKRSEWLGQPWEVSELKPGTHIFAVYGDNLFKTTTYTIEAFEDTTKKLKEIEAQMLRKRNELRQFVRKYRKIDELLKQREIIHSTFTVFKSDNSASGSGSCSNTKVPGEESKADNPGDDANKDRSSKKKWFDLNLNLNLNKSDENASLKEHLLSYDAGDR